MKEREVKKRGRGGGGEKGGVKRRWEGGGEGERRREKRKKEVAEGKGRLHVYTCEKVHGVWCKYDGRVSTHIIFVEDGYPDVSGQDLHTCGEREKGQTSSLNLVIQL